MHFDLPLDQLESYCPPREEPADFDAFWAGTLAGVQGQPLDARFATVDAGLKLVDAFDVTFNGYGGQPVKGWYLRPRGANGPLPCVVEYIGYGGGRGLPLDWLLFSAAGYAHLVMDTRGQGSVWRRGDTADAEPDGGNGQSPGFMTRGVLRPETYYYRRVYTDAVRAIEAALTRPEVDPSRVAVTGGSQGGGIAIAAAALSPAVAALMTNVPFLCAFRRATTLVDTFPYREIAVFLSAHRDRIETVYRTLSYFDNVNLAARATCPALFSTALMDDICPPSTVFAAYNHYAGPKEMRVWPFNDHSGGGTDQTAEMLAWLRRLWA
jgi:cephalosporin-C deacetylase